MGGTSNHTTVVDFNGWMRDIERRVRTQERRSPAFEVQRTLGPGFGKYCTQIFDWNEEATWLTGQFWSPVGAFNTPTLSTIFLGTTLSASQVGGVQSVVSLDGTMSRYQREFMFTPGGTPTFGAWSPM